MQFDQVLKSKFQPTLSFSVVKHDCGIKGQNFRILTGCLQSSEVFESLDKMISQFQGLWSLWKINNSTEVVDDL